MKYYIASKFKQRFFLRDVRTAIVYLGHEVTSSWLDEEVDFPLLTQADKRMIATRDYDKIRKSDVLLLDCTEPLSEGSGGGREAEYGFAQGIGICTARVGPAYNPFHNLADLQFRHWDHFIEVLQKGEEQHGKRKKG